MRITISKLKRTIDIIQSTTNHKITLSTTTGCGVYLTVNGKEYYKSLKGVENAVTGISNKEAYEILEPYYQEASNIIRKKIEKEMI